jgi:hypothetical protein
MDSQTDKKPKNILEGLEKSQGESLGDIIDENLITLKKVHSILLNCINLTKKQKLEFAESERYFMKMYLKKLTDKINNNEQKNNL